MTVTATSGASSQQVLTVYSGNRAPNGTMTGPDTVVPGQEFVATVAADGPGAADMAGGFAYQIYRGTGP